jgi:hypothetical protein
MIYFHAFSAISAPSAMNNMILYDFINTATDISRRPHKVDQKSSEMKRSYVNKPTSSCK